VEPELVEVAPGRTMRCHIALDELARLQATGEAMPTAPVTVSSEGR
jgi:hypothetical protein